MAKLGEGYLSRLAHVLVTAPSICHFDIKPVVVWPLYKVIGWAAARALPSPKTEYRVSGMSHHSNGGVKTMNKKTMLNRPTGKA